MMFLHSDCVMQAAGKLQFGLQLQLMVGAFETTTKVLTALVDMTG